MTKSELVELIASKQTQLSVKDVELAVKTIIEHMSQSLADGQRIEIRGFGSFSSTIGPPAQVVTRKPERLYNYRRNSFRTSSRAKNCVSRLTTV